MLLRVLTVTFPNNARTSSDKINHTNHLLLTGIHKYENASFSSSESESPKRTLPPVVPL